MGKFKKAFSAMLLVLLLTTVSTAVFADVGNNNSYKSSSKHSTSSSSKSYGGSSYGGGYSGLPISLPLPIILIIAGVVVVIYIKNKGNLGNLGNLTNTQNSESVQDNFVSVVPDRTPEIEKRIKEEDPLFSSYSFIGWAKEVYLTINEAWSERDWSKIRPFEKEELFKVHEKQLDEYKRLGRINMMERVSIGEAYLTEYKEDAQYEFLIVCIKSAYNDYIIDEKTKEVVEGNKSTRYTASYKMTFMRSKGVKTDPASGNLSTKQCPHCGAPLQITSAGKCEYCDTVVTTGEHDWVLSDYTSINIEGE